MKNNEILVRAMFLIVSVLLVGAIVIFIYSFRTGQKDDKITIGAVLIGEKDDNGWNESHYFGIKKACETYQCEMFEKTSVPEEKGAVKKAVSELIKSGCDCIFLTSYGYGTYLDEIAKENPDKAFYSISGEATQNNCSAYFARMYQARYLAGIVAGAATKSGTLAYVSSMPIPETVRAVNAYALGAQKANPDAKVMVKYTGSWDDKEKEEAAVREAAAAGADVITFHEDKPYAIDLADEMGLYTTGYDYVSKRYSEKFLTAAIFNWDMLYEKIMNDYLSGRANFSKNYWLGLSDGAVSLYPYSKLVSDKTKKLVSSEEERIKTWRDVFSGEIYDNTGKIRCNGDERIGDDELFNSIDWYVKGVEVYD